MAVTRVTGRDVKDSAIKNADVAADADIDGTKVKAASVTVRGTVELATDGESSSGLAVQANDGRLARSHVLATTTALGPDHTVSGLTAGQVLKAGSATEAAFVQLQHSQIGGVTHSDAKHASNDQYDALVGEGTPSSANKYATKTYVDGVATAAPSGLIAMWHGLLASIPAGWVLCNGANGTPDLRDRFVYGAPDATEPGDTGGALSHTHCQSGTTEAASTGVGDCCCVSTTTQNVAVSQPPHTHSYCCDTDCASSLPPYYTVLFIMKS